MRLPILLPAFLLCAAGVSLGAQPLAPVGSTNHLKVWSSEHNLRGVEGWLVEQWGQDTVVVRLRGYNGRLVGAGSETLVLPLAQLQRLQVFGPAAKPRRGWSYAGLALLGTAAFVSQSGERSQFRRSQMVGGAIFGALFVAIGSQREDRSFGWADIPLRDRRSASTAAPPDAPDR